MDFASQQQEASKGVSWVVKYFQEQILGRDGTAKLSISSDSGNRAASTSGGRFLNCLVDLDTSRTKMMTQIPKKFCVKNGEVALIKNQSSFKKILEKVENEIKA